LLLRVLTAAWLLQNRSLQIKDLVGTDDDRLWTNLGDGHGLGAGQQHGDIRRRTPLSIRIQCLPDAGLIDLRCNHIEPKPRILEEASTNVACGSQYQRYTSILEHQRSCHARS